MDGVKMIQVIPSYAAVGEGALYVMESVENDFNNLLMTTGISELQEGVKDLGAKLKSNKVLEGLKEVVKKAWAYIQGLFEKALGWLKDKTKSVKKAIDNAVSSVDKKVATNIENKIVKFLNGLDADKEYNFGTTISGPASNIANNKYIDEVDKLIDKCAKLFESYMASDEKDLAGYADDLNEIRNFRDEIITGCKDLYQPKEVDAKYVTDWYKQMVMDVTDYPKTSSALKKSFNDSKKQIKKMSDAIDKSARSAEASVKSDVSKCAQLIKSGIQAVTAVDNEICSALAKKISSDARIIIKIYAGVVKEVEKEAKKEEKVSESTTVEASSFQTELASLFNF